MAGVSKKQIALKQTERAELLHEREELRQKIAAVNEKLKAQRIAQSRAVEQWLVENGMLTVRQPQTVLPHFP